MKGITFALFCASSYALFFSNSLQILFHLPGDFLFRSLPHHSARYQLWLCPLAAAVKFLTLLCSFADPLSREGRRSGQSSSSLLSLLTRVASLGCGEACAHFVVALKGPWLCALFQALWVPPFL